VLDAHGPSLGSVEDSGRTPAPCRGSPESRSFGPPSGLGYTASPRGRSSVGRASASQAEGRGFDPRRPLQRKQAETRSGRRVSASLALVLLYRLKPLKTARDWRSLARKRRAATQSITAPPLSPALVVIGRARSTTCLPKRIEDRAESRSGIGLLSTDTPWPEGFADRIEFAAKSGEVGRHSLVIRRLCCVHRLRSTQAHRSFVDRARGAGPAASSLCGHVWSNATGRPALPNFPGPARRAPEKPCRALLLYR
jgi:hypothetical protein